MQKNLRNEIQIQLMDTGCDGIVILINETLFSRRKKVTAAAFPSTVGVKVFVSPFHQTGGSFPVKVYVIIIQ